MRIVHAACALTALLCAVASGQQPGFVNDVLPVLTKAGCNAGSCHGAASGKNGFMLSLFGYDPERDWFTLTHELRGRRLDPSCPDDSLMLRKATARVPHQGGKRLPPDSALYTTVRDWIARGAPDDRASAPRLLGIAVEPAQAELIGLDRPLQLRIRALYADNSELDVTALALGSSTNDAVLAVDGQGAAASRGAGEAYVLARFSGFAVVAQVQVHADATPFVWPGAPEHGFVDELVDQKLVRAHVVPAPVCSDEVFVRRLFLDLLDVPPTPAETRAFLADPASDSAADRADSASDSADSASDSADRRARLVDA